MTFYSLLVTVSTYECIQGQIIDRLVRQKLISISALTRVHDLLLTLSSKYCMKGTKPATKLKLSTFV